MQLGGRAPKKTFCPFETLAIYYISIMCNHEYAENNLCVAGGHAKGIQNQNQQIPTVC
jgi:hypothetical protein